MTAISTRARCITQRKHTEEIKSARSSRANTYTLLALLEVALRLVDAVLVRLLVLCGQQSQGHRASRRRKRAASSISNAVHAHTEIEQDDAYGCVPCGSCSWPSRLMYGRVARSNNDTSSSKEYACVCEVAHRARVW